MNTNEKKELLMKLANELTDELADDEKLFLACSFNDYDKETITMSEKQTTIYEDGLKIIRDCEIVQVIKDNLNIELSIEGRNVWIKENGETKVYLEW